MATSVNSITFEGYTYSVGDIIMINTTELAYYIHSPSTSVSIPAAKECQWEITALHVADDTDTPNYPVSIKYYSGAGGYGSGTIKLENIVSGSGGTPITLDVTFYRNTSSSDTTNTTKTYTYGVSGQAFSNNGWSKSGYTLLGWSESSTATTATYSVTNSVADSWILSNVSPVKLYAIWSKTIKLTYDGNKGNGSTSVSNVPSAQSATVYNSTTSYKFTLSSTKPTRTGYTFLGWSTSSTATSASYSAGGNITLSDSDILYAVWDANPYPYNIVYKSSSGVQLGTGTVTKDFDTTSSISPQSFTGYTSPSAQSVTWNSTSAKTITFTYTPIDYSITYTLNGSTVTSNPTSYNIETTTFTLNNPTKTGYTFTGWTDDNGVTSMNMSVFQGATGNLSFTANWVVHKLTVNYYSNYATEANFADNYELLNEVSKDVNVLVHSREFKYDTEYNTGLHNYSESGNVLYMKRLGYTATGNWGTSPDGGTLIGEDDSFSSGQAMAEKVGLSLASGNASINLYAQWDPANIAFYKINGAWKLCYTYIKVGGIWKPAIMYKKIKGTWKRSVLK